ncbi:TIR domain-containing protein [Allosphingosinicella sp.]|uniref:TIR domain-containing protein n=1 Tax=Allosphingosinicella sp. TaxID=2823234 RepID=UPI0037831A7A
MAGHVFISHGSENSDEANALCAFIEARGVKCWIAPRDVRPGIDYSVELQSAIEEAAAFVVLVTEMANKSPYVRAETEMAFSCHKPIFPVRQADIKPAAGLALFLKIRHWTDAFGTKRDAAMDRLALELQTVAGVAPEAAPAPSPAPTIPPPAPTPAPTIPPAAPAPAPTIPPPATTPPTPAPTMPPQPLPDQERLEAAIGPNAAYYVGRWQAMDASRKQASWNWAACLGSMFWFAYRKMWAPTIILGLVFVALNLLSLLSTGLMIAGALLSIVAVTATGALGTSFYRQHVRRLVNQTGSLEREPALAQLRVKGGVSKAAVLILAAIALAVAGGAGYYGWRAAKRAAVSDDPFFQGATSGPGNARMPDSQNPVAQNPGTQVPGIGPNGEVDEEALRNALAEARNLLEQQGVNPDQLQDQQQYQPQNPPGN